MLLHANQWSEGRYRWRTNLRGVLPFRPPLYKLIPKGRHDCGSHDWFNVDGEHWACYHCRVGWHTGRRPPDEEAD